MTQFDYETQVQYVDGSLNEPIGSYRLQNDDIPHRARIRFYFLGYRSHTGLLEGPVYFRFFLHSYSLDQGKTWYNDLTGEFTYRLDLESTAAFIWHDKLKKILANGLPPAAAVRDLIGKAAVACWRHKNVEDRTYCDFGPFTDEEDVEQGERVEFLPWDDAPSFELEKTAETAEKVPANDDLPF